MTEQELLEDLNPPQKEAVLHEGGPLLVLAGAGSGKTRVITRRIAYLVQKHQVPAWRILAVTFTNKAAREMKERLHQMLGEEVGRELTVSTFHSASAIILRREHQLAGLSKSFVIYDDSDQLSLVKRAIREEGIELSQVTPRDILHRIDQEKNAGRMPDQMTPGDDPKAQLTQKVYRAYTRLLRAANAVDFGDLLLLLVQLLKNNGELRAKYQRRFQHVLVDEFQDTNPVQYQLLRLLAPPGSNLAVVGDDDQSIYRWRGAQVDNILGFPKDYPGTLVVKLEQNYRSDQNILEAAHAVISRNRNRMDKKLWSERPSGEKLQLVIARDERGEAQEVAARIHELRTQGVVDFDQTAVFYRTNAQSRVLEEVFRLARVPYTLVSGRSFYDRAEIRDASSYLRLMVNPQSDADLLRVINVPARGIGDTTVERLMDAAASAGVSIYQTIANPERVPGLNNGMQKRLLTFRAMLDSMVTFASTATNATDAARFMLNATQLVGSYKEEGTQEALTRAENLLELLTATREFDKTLPGAPTAAGETEVDLDPGPPPQVVVQPEVEAPPDAPKVAPKKPRARKLADAHTRDLFGEVEAPAEPEAIVPSTPAVASAQDDVVDQVTGEVLEDDRAPLAVGIPPLQAFLEQISLVGDADGSTEGGRVSLMTLHSAKGLEFDSVFITGMEEEIFPTRRATGPEAAEEDMAEERRLCYVGFTRARRRLHITLAQHRTLFGELRFNPPSRFLSEVPQPLFDLPVEPPPVPRSPMIRRYSDDDDSGPVIDRTYDQSTDFHQSGGGDDVRGMKVQHSQFGPGVVIGVNGKGPNAKLQVKFQNGVKTVIARFLTPT